MKLKSRTPLNFDDGIAMAKQQVLLTLDDNFHFKLNVAAIARGVSVAELLNDMIDEITDVRKRQDMQLFIGAMVHYQSYGTPNGEYTPEHRAAVVTAIKPDGVIDATVINPTGFFFNQDLPFAETPTPGHWNFIPDQPYVKAVGEQPVSNG